MLDEHLEYSVRLAQPSNFTGSMSAKGSSTSRRCLPLPSIQAGMGQTRWYGLFWKDKRPAWVQAEERELIKAVHNLQTLQTTPRGGMRIDSEELRDQILESQDRYKDLVKR